MINITSTSCKYCMVLIRLIVLNGLVENVRIQPLLKLVVIVADDDIVNTLPPESKDAANNLGGS